MVPSKAILGVNDPMEEVMQKFDRTNAVDLPVIDVNNHLIGFINRTRMYTVYRKMVADYSAE
jgi:CIC family chloride channel protein